MKKYKITSNVKGFFDCIPKRATFKEIQAEVETNITALIECNREQDMVVRDPEIIRAIMCCFELRHILQSIKLLRELP